MDEGYKLMTKLPSEDMAKILASLEQGIAVASQEGLIRYYNQAFFELAGLKQEEITAIPWTDCFSCLSTEMIPWHEQATSALEKGLIWRGRVMTREHTTQPKELALIVYSLDHTEGPGAGIVMEARDTSDEASLEERLKRAQRMETLGELAGGIVHDFNNILSGIIGYAELARFETEPGSNMHQMLESILLASKRAADLIGNILAFSRKTEESWKPVHLQPIMREALRFLRASLPSTISIQSDISDDAGAVLADPTQCHQVIMNLCTNAYQAMADSGGEMKIALQVAQIHESVEMTQGLLTPGPYVCLTVTDTGPGIRPSMIEQIFDPYFTTKGNHGGTGLGLTMVQAITLRLKGAIAIDTEIGQGTSFTVYFPMLMTHTIQDAGENRETVASMGHEHILFIDDEEILCDVTASALAHYGYDVTVYSDSTEAMEAFRLNPGRFDLVITDQTMPELTGLELASKVNELRPDVPVILCSGYSELLNNLDSQAIPVSARLQKPVDMDELARIVRIILDGGEV